MRLDRIQAIDVHQGPLQRAFGVFAVDVQTGAGAKGGEISLPALTPEAVAELRALRAGRGGRARARAGPPVAAHQPARAGDRRADGRASSGSSLPVLAGAFQVAPAARRPRAAARRRCAGCRTRSPRSCSAPPALLVLAWLLSTAGALVAFGGFTLVRDGERLRIRRGLVQRSEATVPVSRVRAVRVVEGVFRRPFGLAALTVEVTGYADEAAAARTLFPLVRVRDVEALLDEFLPELADDPRRAGAPAAARRAALLPVAAADRRGVQRRRVVPGRPVRARAAAARRALRPRALARRGLAAARRPPGGALDAARPHDRARPGALPRVAHGGAERLPAPGARSPT